jgi:glutaredoxin 3
MIKILNPFFFRHHVQVMVFSWSSCPFCKKAKALLDATGAKYTAIELNEMEDGQAYRAALALKTDRTSMPNIFIGGEACGGCNDGPGVATLEKEGKLRGMLQAAGAL